jgi:hypothetical protein
MTSTQRLELEIELLEKKKQAVESDLAYKQCQANLDMPTEQGMGDSSVVLLTLNELKRDRDRLDVALAEKRLEVYDIQGGGTNK